MEIYPGILLLAGLVSLDTTAGPQVLISEPMVSCTLLGLMFGDVRTGIMAGTIFQLLWFGYKPLGAVRIPDGNMAGFISTASLLIAMKSFHTGFAALIPALLFGVFTGFVGSLLETSVRRRNAGLSERIVSKLERGETVPVGLLHFTGLGVSFSRGVAMAAVLVPAGALFCGLVSFLPGAVNRGISSSLAMIWGTACASAVAASLVKGNGRALTAGALVGIIWIFTVYRIN